MSYRIFLILLLLPVSQVHAISLADGGAGIPDFGAKGHTSSASTNWVAGEVSACSLCDGIFSLGAPHSNTAAIDLRYDNRDGGQDLNCLNKYGANSSQCEVDLKFCTVGTEYFDATDGTCKLLTDPNCLPNEEVTQFTVGGETQYWCTPNFDEPPENPQCDDPLYTYEDQTICSDNQDECEAAGGTFGFIGEGAGTQGVCIPDAYADDLPTCDISSVGVLEGGGFACASPTAPHPDQDIPDSTENPLPDQDGDGIPDRDDPDIDGDGIPNGQDTDTDGDGIDDDDDLDPNGEEEGEGEDNKVSGGGSCSVRPNCQGDAIQCAILFQTWATRCDNEGQSSGGDSCDSAPECDGDAVGCAVLSQAWKNRCENRNETQAELDTLTTELGEGQLFTAGDDFSTIMGSVYNQTGAAGSCPAPLSMNIAGTSIDVSYQWICDLSTAIRPLVIIGFSFLAFGFVMRAF